MKTQLLNTILNTRILSAVLLCALCVSCNPQDKDLTPPEILPVGEMASPLNCQEFPCGGFIPFTYAFSDDYELGSFNLEVHSNADHHTHSTEAEDCHHEGEHEDEHEPVNPWIFNQDYAIPSGKTYYEADFRIPIPQDVDPGEYHFMIRVTDASGWQQIRSVSIGLVEAE